MRRTSAKGSTFVTAQVRCNAEDGESVLCSVIAFQAATAEALVGLAAGDTVAVAGPAALSQWEKNGEHKVGLKVTATRVLSVYEAGMRRKAASSEREPPDSRPLTPPAAPQRGRPTVRRERPTKPVNSAGGLGQRRAGVSAIFRRGRRRRSALRRLQPQLLRIQSSLQKRTFVQLLSARSSRS